MDTTQKIKSQFPDLNFVKPLPVDKHPRYQKFGIQLSPNKHTVLPRGHLKETGRRKILVDSVFERDVPIPLRDGLKAYADVFRPQSSDEIKVPAAICWSPYGKASSGLTVDNLPYRLGIPKDRTSGYETFEGLDPADWCNRGYAVVNVDARGSQFSDGTYFFWGDQEAEDIYDAIEFLSKQPWCNGSVCMGGNSYLAKAQVSFASRLSHAALKALAPWEGFTDIYRQLYRRGGFAMNNVFAALYQSGVAGEHEVEDMAGMVKSHPLFDDYWAGKYDEVEKIDVPLYLLGSFSNPFHIYGSFDTFRRARSKQKWLRVHSTFEWYEMYEHASNDDLQRFFDRYCKGVMNGWEHDTPPLRLSLIGFDGSLPNIVQRPETEFPLRRQQLKKFYLDGATKTLHASARESELSVFHEGHSLDASSVSHIFQPNYAFITRVTRLTAVGFHSQIHRIHGNCRLRQGPLVDVLQGERRHGRRCPDPKDRQVWHTPGRHQLPISSPRKRGPKYKPVQDLRPTGFSVRIFPAISRRRTVQSRRTGSLLQARLRAEDPTGDDCALGYHAVADGYGLCGGRRSHAACRGTLSECAAV